MLKTALIAALLLLTGCATPQEFINRDPDARINLKLAPEQAALCLTRNIESRSGSISVDRRPASQAGHWEIVSRVHADVTVIYAIAQIAPAAAGSQATLWVGSHLFVPKATVIAEITKGC